MRHWIITGCVLFSVSFNLQAQDLSNPQGGYKFTITKDMPATAVKNQNRSGTCWSFSGIALLESELLRMGKGEFNLSEMWIVRNAYFDKAVKYVRMHGNANFGGGGAMSDVIEVIRKYGAIPQESYPGLNYGLDNHDHAELDAILGAYVKTVVSNKGKTLTTAWKDGLNGILDAYFGPVPKTFIYKGKEYTPESFASSLGLKMDDYVSITSFSHHPFYTQFAIEIPDNWDYLLSYNIPLDEFNSLMETAVMKGYTFAWGADVSEKGFAYSKGLAVVPEADLTSMDGTEQAKWVVLTDKEKDDALYKFNKPGKEKTITQEIRQAAFDNYDTTDDHGMLITGLATDQAGNKYFRVKNSWDTKQLYGGYFYASYPFVSYKTINIVLHKDALPKELRNRLGIK